MDYCSTKDNMNKAEMLSDDVTKNIRSIMLRLPNVLTKHNIYLFVMACEKIEKMKRDSCRGRKERYSFFLSIFYLILS